MEKVELPIVGKSYYAYLGGDITPSAQTKVVITDIIDSDEFAACDPDDYKAWKCHTTAYATEEFYNPSTDYFIKAIDKDNDNKYIFVRTKDGRWFSYGNSISYDLRLDNTGKLTEGLSNFLKCTSLY